MKEEILVNQTTYTGYLFKTNTNYSPGVLVSENSGLFYTGKINTIGINKVGILGFAKMQEWQQKGFEYIIVFGQ